MSLKKRRLLDKSKVARLKGDIVDPSFYEVGEFKHSYNHKKKMMEWRVLLLSVKDNVQTSEWYPLSKVEPVISEKQLAELKEENSKLFFNIQKLVSLFFK